MEEAAEGDHEKKKDDIIKVTRNKIRDGKQERKISD